MRSSSRKKGYIAEKISVKYLSKLGYKIVCTNWYCRYSEIDIIAFHKNELVFIEVKSVTKSRFYTPEELFSLRKKRKLLKAVSLYLKEIAKSLVKYRLDLVCLTFEPRKIWIEHYINALGC